jgi:S-methyl-5-thioribose-1-phosphate isomerase
VLPRTIDWASDEGRTAGTVGSIIVVDQTRLPDLHLRRLTTPDELVDAIRRLVVRGAPALGVAGALGVALCSAYEGATPRWVRAQAARIAEARPTAVNLAWGVRVALASLERGPDAVLAAALKVRDDEIASCHAIGARAASWLRDARDGAPLRMLTHCNAGSMACVEWGTALGVVRSLHERARVESVLVDETRPLLQGARITAFELAHDGIPHRVIVDGAGPSAIARGLVDVVVVGADRIAANGDVANKIGTYPLALAAVRAGVPFVVAAPESTVDLDTPDGAAIDIEDRGADEVLLVAGHRLTPVGSNAWNPAFDVTPADLVSAVITERRVWQPGT